MLDRDLAELYREETRSLIQAVKRNIDRFPSDFMFQFTQDEFNSLRGDFKGFWAVSVSGNWRVLFRFEDNNAVDVNYLDYH